VPDARWQDFEAAAPELAAAGRRLLYRGEEIASAFLATVAHDGGARVHPVSPVLAGGDLWLFVVDLSPKYRDLVANGRYALHTMLTPEGGEEFYLRGRAEAVPGADARAPVIAATGGRQGHLDFEALFRCHVESVLHTRWENSGTPQAWPTYAKWRPWAPPNELTHANR